MINTLAVNSITETDFKTVFENLQKKSILCRSEKISDRKKRLRALLSWIEGHEKEIKRALYSDFKKPESEVDISEIYPVTSEIRHALSNLNSWSSSKKIDAPLSLLGTTSYIQYEPKGVCLIIAPWNFPFNLAIGPLVSCLAAGNTALIKPSEMTPNTSELISKMITEVFPADEVAVAIGGIEVSQSVLLLPFDHIFFTGSPQVGKVIMRAAAENLTSVTLELGGKSPAIIDKSANVKDAAEKLAWGKFLNNGQTCIAPDYIMVHESVQDQLIAELKLFIDRQFNGSNIGYHQSPDYGRIVNERHFSRLNNLLENAITEGAEMVMGENADATDNHLPPIILKNVSLNSLIMEEEIFGPILPIITFSNLDEAIDLVNSKPKPLALYYFGNSGNNKKKILSSTSSGGTCINDCVLHFTHINLPFGGVNNSGIGKSHGVHGFLTFSNEKSVLKQRVGFTSSKFIYPPYSKFTKAIISIVKKYL